MKIVLTELGEQLLGTGYLSGSIPSIITVKFGDGGGGILTPVKTMTSLVNMISVGLGNNAIKLSNPDRAYIHSYIPNTIGDITIRELGLYDADDQLIAIGGEFERYKPSVDIANENMDFYISISVDGISDLSIQFTNTSMFVDSGVMNELKLDLEEQFIEIAKVNEIISDTITPLVVKPNINNPRSGIINFTGPFTSSDYKTTGGFTGLLTSLVWQLSATSTFDVVLEEVTYTTLQVYIPTTLNPSTVYYVRLRHISNTYKSYWSDVTMFTSPALDLGSDGLNTLLAGDDVTGGFYGELNLNKLLSTRNYRGSYRTATLFKTNSQVSYGGKKWNALVDVTSVIPGTDATKWVEDTRENLPTGKWLLDVCGVAYGLTDNNNDTLSTGSTSIGPLKNDNNGWLKVSKNNKILYIAKKPFVATISWNDLAKRTLVYGDRTVRIGSKLYYIRLIKEDEYTDCLARLIGGDLWYYRSDELAISEKIWVHDKQEGLVRKVYSNTNTVETISPKARTCSYRPVLELIPTGAEPYNNLPSCPVATSENFQYDQYTDTGYFGVVPYTSLIAGSALATTIGLTAGTAQNDTEGYLKFYWHGKIIYMAKKTFRHSLSWDHIYARNAIYGIDLGNVGKSNINTAGFNFNVAIPTGNGKSIADDIQYWNNYLSDGGVPTLTDAFIPNLALEIGKYSMWNELLYRVHAQFVDEILANQAGDANYKELTGGVQIGSNWATFTDIDLSIYYTTSGNGTATWCQETSSYDPSNRTNRGHYRLAVSNRAASSDVSTGLVWRPLLILN